MVSPLQQSRLGNREPELGWIWGDESGERKRGDESSVTRSRESYCTLKPKHDCRVWWGAK